MNSQPEPNKKKSWFETVRKYKFPIIGVVIVIIIIIVLLSTGKIGEGMTNWTSPDYKLLKKSHTGHSRRSDNKNDNWSKKDMIEAVSRFNRLATE